MRGGQAGGAPYIYRVSSQITTQEDLMETATDRQTHTQTLKPLYWHFETAIHPKYKEATCFQFSPLKFGV